MERRTLTLCLYFSLKLVALDEAVTSFSKHPNAVPHEQDLAVCVHAVRESAFTRSRFHVTAMKNRLTRRRGNILVRRTAEYRCHWPVWLLRRTQAPVDGSHKYTCMSRVRTTTTVVSLLVVGGRIRAG